MNDRGMIAQYLTSSLVNILNLKTQADLKYQRNLIQLGLLNFLKIEAYQLLSSAIC